MEQSEITGECVCVYVCKVGGGVVSHLTKLKALMKTSCFSTHGQPTDKQQRDACSVFREDLSQTSDASNVKS